MRKGTLTLNHKDIAITATKYAQRLFKCSIGAWEFSIADEVCDGFLARSNETFLIEAKTSMQDFKRDKRKAFRTSPEKGIGMFRLYAAPKGVLKLEELPEKWGLIEVDEKGKCSFDYRVTDEEIKTRILDMASVKELYTLRGLSFDEKSMPIIKNEHRFRHKSRQFERNLEKELRALYYLAQRYKKREFMRNIL